MRSHSAAVGAATDWRTRCGAIGSGCVEFMSGPRPYLMLIGFGLTLAFWHFSVDVWRLPRFKEMPGLTEVLREWSSAHPAFGISLFTADYYRDIWVSCRRVAISFFVATSLGIPIGLLLGWSRKFRGYVFSVFELLRPIPVIAWVPLAILMFTGQETPVIFLVSMASLFATALNTKLGVESVDESCVRAAQCLGAKRHQIFWHVIIPGALPCVFTGLQIGVGVAWFSLVVGEMVSGQFGLGYRINAAYTTVAYPTMAISMITLGVVGYVSSALIRILGNALMQWRASELAL
jgi:ABC-type nitrate/sulfonate/bicarbonate transport system permease component